MRDAAIICSGVLMLLQMAKMIGRSVPSLERTIYMKMNDGAVTYIAEDIIKSKRLLRKKLE